MSRLIDAEDFARVVKEYCKDCIDHNKHTMEVVDFNADIQDFLENQPTAFDVEKVVEQLEEKSQLIRPVGWAYPQEVILTKDVMKIVKRGGIDDN